METPTIPGYEIFETIGKGGMGTVYRAHQISLDRDVAIKILPTRLAQDPAFVERFHIEARAAAKIRHPSIVQVYDAGEYEADHYFVMEYIDGETTKSRLERKGRLAEDTLLLIAEYVGMGLQCAWQHGKIIHRDIKPDNILIDKDGTVKVTDLGLAKFVGGSRTTLTMLPMAMGTPYYCSPEQARGLPDVDFRTDIYALGATLYHLATGTAPFADSTGVTAMAHHISEQIPDPLELNPAISSHLAWLIEKMMAKDMLRRHSSWGAVIDDIHAVAEGQPPREPFVEEGESTISRCAARAALQKGHTRASGEGAPKTAASQRTSPIFRLFLALSSLLTITLFLTTLHMTQAERRQTENADLAALIRRYRPSIRATSNTAAHERAIDALQRFASVCSSETVRRSALSRVELHQYARTRMLAAQETAAHRDVQILVDRKRREQEGSALLAKVETFAKQNPTQYETIMARCRAIYSQERYAQTAAALRARNLAAAQKKNRAAAATARLRKREQERLVQNRHMLAWKRSARHLLLRLHRREYLAELPRIRDRIPALVAEWQDKTGLGPAVRDNVEIWDETVTRLLDMFRLVETRKGNVAGMPVALLRLPDGGFRVARPEDVVPPSTTVPPRAKPTLVQGAVTLIGNGRLWLRVKVEHGHSSYPVRLQELPASFLADLIQAADPEAQWTNLAVFYIADGHYDQAARYVTGAREQGFDMDRTEEWLRDCRDVETNAAYAATAPAPTAPREAMPHM